MSVQYCDVDDARSVISTGSGAISQARSCPPVPIRSRARMKKAAPLPPSKVTTPLSLSLADLHQHQHPIHRAPSSGGGMPPLSMSSGVPPGSLRDQGDECAINELLEGRMDLDIVLPDARKVRMNIERRTPMMDLLVQVTTAHKVNPGGHVIHIPSDRGPDYLQYKPSTPIGSLDTNSIHIVPKSSVYDQPIKKMPKMANKPFEQTFRLQVNLPRSQLMVLRVSPRTTLGEVKLMACREKNMDPSRYMLSHPQRPDALLDLNGTMASYGATEITLMSNSNFNANVCNSTSDLIAYVAREDNQKKKGILGLFTRKKSKGSVVDSSSDSLDSRGVSPSRSDGSGPRNTTSAKVSIKKRPAPPPPPKISNQKVKESPPEIITTSTTSLPPTIEQPVVKVDVSNVSHSRHSSDSSGYHEASLLSESPDNHSLDVCSGSGSSGLSMESSTQPVKNKRRTSTPNKPTQPKAKPIMMSSLSDNQLLITAAARKRRAPLPPSVSKSTEELYDSGKPHNTSSEVMEAVILEEPVTEQFEEEDDDHELQTQIYSPEPASSPPVSEAESGLVEDIEKPLQVLLAGSPTEISPPPSPHTDSGLALGDSQDDMDDMDLIFPYMKDGIGRRTSLTSLGTIDDVQNSFDLTIAEAQKVLDDEEKRYSLSSEDFLEEEDNLDAPIVVEVIQNQILSRIEAAFSAVEQEGDEEGKPISPLAKDDDIGWVYTIPEPPLAFRNDDDLQETETRAHIPSSSQSTVSSEGVPPPLPAVPPPTKESLQITYIKKSPPVLYVKDTSSLPTFNNSPPEVKKLSPPVLLKDTPLSFKEPSTPPVVRDFSSISLLKEPAPSPPAKEPVVYYSQVDPEDVESRDTVENHLLAPKSRRPPLLNFTIGTYRTPKEDIFSDFESGDAKNVPNTAPVLLGEPMSVPVSLEVNETPMKTKKHIMYGMEGSVRGIRGQVRLRCAEMVDTVGPALVARSASMLSLTPTSRRIEVDGKVKHVQRTSSSVADNLRKAQSVQDLNIDDSVSDENLEQEQERLQQEYSKLHQQFLAWNKQLQDNQSLLEKQKIVSVSTLLPSLPAKEPEKVVVNGRIATSIAAVAEEAALRSQTLPRSKPKPIVEPPAEDKRTFTLDRRPKPQILANVTIGSWQQRKSTENVHVLPPTEKTQFHSLDSSNQIVPEEKRNGHHPPSKPPVVAKRPVSMYASWQKPQVDDSDKLKPKFDVQFSSNQSQPSSLRTSTTKTYFKPPEVKTSSISRQRIPPEDIQRPPEDTSSTTNIWKMPPKEPPKPMVRENNVLKKFVFGQNGKNEYNNNGGGKTVTYLNVDKASNESNIKTFQVNGKIHASNGVATRPSFSIKAAPKVVGFRANGSSEPPISREDVTPPPPPPQVPSKGSLVVAAPPPPPPPKLESQHPIRSSKSAQLLRAPKLDPREELMLEIRNFGGRKTLRKVPVSQINWQLKVHGTTSTITA